MLVYLDIVMFLNFVVDFLLILGTNRLSGYPLQCSQAALSATLGGTYAGMCMLPGFQFLSKGLWRFAFLVLMALLAFGWGRTALQRGTVFFLLSMALGGLAVRFRTIDFGTLCLCALLLWILCRLSFRSALGIKQYIPVELLWKEKRLKLMALVDTGNRLLDPLTGESVLVCGCDVGEELFGIPSALFAEPVNVLDSGLLSGWRLIPYDAVGNSGGLLPVIRLKNIRIGGKTTDALVAFAPNRIGNGGNYRMLTGGTW